MAARPFQRTHQSKMAGLAATMENTHVKIHTHTHIHTNGSSSKTVAKCPILPSSILSLFSHNDVRFTTLVNLLTVNTRKASQGHSSLHTAFWR